jgi:tetratricopeptide (TPR) repeat protein
VLVYELLILKKHFEQPTGTTRIEFFKSKILYFALFNCMCVSTLFAQLHIEPIAGDNEFTTMNYPAAIAAYDSLLRTTSSLDSTHVLWRLARVHVCIGDVAEGDVSRDEYRKAEKYALRAMQLDSSLSEVRTWYAAAIGSVALHEGGKTKVLTAWEIKRQIDCAIALNPNNDIAYSILGSFHRALGGLSWIERSLAALFVGKLPDGSFEDGEKALKKAIELNPQTPRHYYELGRLYYDWNKNALAKEAFARSITLPFMTAHDLQNKADAEQRLAELNAE